MDGELDNILKSEESQLTKDKEIDRILAANAADYFDLLTINPFLVDETEIPQVVKNIYRKKARLIHPDKSVNPQASNAFDKLKKAEQVLSVADENDDKVLFEEKQRLLAIYKDVKPAAVESDWNNVSNRETRRKVSEILKQELKDQEIERLYQQREEVQKNQELDTLKKKHMLKKKLEAKWEDDRDARVQNWRSYTSKIEKKQEKQKKKRLGKKNILA
mgnify:CR=1 FL=1